MSRRELKAILSGLPIGYLENADKAVAKLTPSASTLKRRMAREQAKEAKLAAQPKRLKLSLEALPLSDLKPPARNLHHHEQGHIERIAASIQQFGFSDPIVIDRDNRVIDGEGRRRAAEMLKIQSVPVLRIHNLDRQGARGLAIARNWLAKQSKWNAAGLGDELQSLLAQKIDVAPTGIAPAALKHYRQLANDRVLKKVEAPLHGAGVHSIIEKGDIWILGEHRLFCGDLDDPRLFSEVLGGKQLDAAFLDFWDTRWHREGERDTASGGEEVHELGSSQRRARMTHLVRTCIALTKPRAKHLVVSDMGFLREVLAVCDPLYRNVLDTRSFDVPLDEYFKDIKFLNNLATLYDTPVSSKSRASDRQSDYNLRGIYLPIAGFLDPLFGRSAQRELTKLNTFVIGRLLGQFVSPKERVLLPFAGFGASMVACERLFRSFVAIEPDPQNAETAIERFAKFARITPILQSTGEDFFDVTHRRMREQNSNGAE